MTVNMTAKRKIFPLKTALMTCGVLSSLFLSGCSASAIKYSGYMAEGFTDSLLRPSAAPLQSQEPLSIEQVRVRALTHNSEYARSQAQLLETVRKAGVRGKELLPTAYANSYGTWRNNTSASVGEKVNETNSDAAREFYTAQDQGVAISNYTASWDLLELGLSSFKSNRRKINAYSEGEQNTYMCNKLIVDVENAYWRAVAFEQAEAKSEWLKGRIEYALELSKTRAQENPDTVLQELMFQREIIDINRWYQSLYRSLLSSKPDLARLMNLPAGAQFDLQSTELPYDLGELAGQDALSLISTAYRNRPEIRKSRYVADLTALKNKEDLWRLLPAMRLFVGGNNDTNSFLLNQDFVSAGASLSWDLMRLGQIPSLRRKGALSFEHDQLQTQVMASAIMGQVMIAREQIQKLTYDVSLASTARSVQDDITSRFKESVKQETQAETYLVKEQLMRELVTLRQQMAQADLHTANARLQQSVGLVPLCQAPEPMNYAAPIFAPEYTRS